MLSILKIFWVWFIKLFKKNPIHYLIPLAEKCKSWSTYFCKRTTTKDQESLTSFENLSSKSIWKDLFKVKDKLEINLKYRKLKFLSMPRKFKSYRIRIWTLLVLKKEWSCRKNRKMPNNLNWWSKQLLSINKQIQVLLRKLGISKLIKVINQVRNHHSVLLMHQT